MTLQEYVDRIKLELTGGILELEIPDETIAKVVNVSMKELQRYIDSTEMMTVPFASCIDLKDSNVSSVSRVYRTEGYAGDTSQMNTSTVADPFYAQMWTVFTNGGTMYNLNDYVMNYLSYNTLLQMRNTVSTDLSFIENHQERKLYINAGGGNPTMITIAYVPELKDVSDIKSDYWSDVLVRLSVAQTKLVLGRIRSRYKQSSSLWEQDGDTLLAEANEELKTLRESLMVNSQMIYPRD